MPTRKKQSLLKSYIEKYRHFDLAFINLYTFLKNFFIFILIYFEEVLITIKTNYSSHVPLDQFEVVFLNLINNLFSNFFVGQFVCFIFLVFIFLFVKVPTSSIVYEDAAETNPFVKSKGLKFYGVIQNPNSTKYIHMNKGFYDDVPAYLALKADELSNLSCVAGMSSAHILSDSKTGDELYVLPPKGNLTIFEFYTYNQSLVQLYYVIKILIEAHTCPKTPLVYFFRETTRRHGCNFGAKIRLYDLSWATTTESRACVYLVQVVFRQLLTTTIKFVFRK